MRDTRGPQQGGPLLDAPSVLERGQTILNPEAILAAEIRKLLRSFNNDHKSVQELVGELSESAEAMSLVLSSVSAKANISTPELMRLLDEAKLAVKFATRIA